jgi:hypothetical protein
MTEAVAGKKLAGICRHVVSEWESGRDWRWPSAGRDGIEGLKGIELDPKWADYASLASVYWFLYKASEAITEGLSGFDNLSWEETLMALEESAGRLERGKSIEDPSVLSYMPNNASGCNPFGSFARLFGRN